MMDLESAIQHCKEQVQEQAKKGCYSCAEEHQQLAEWLKELKEYRENTCGDAISRKHLLEEIAMLKKSPWFNENTYGSKVIRKEAVEIVEDVCIKREPSVTPQQRTGRWKIKDGKEQGYDIGGVKTWYIQIMCSECGFIKTVIEGHTGQYCYCPNCGTRMEVQDADSN